jgi:L-rhamnose mutarotase
MKRYGQIIGVKPEHFEEYKKYHAAVWPDVLKMITDCNIRNYSIFHKDNQLFAYFEYVGDDFAADMAKMAADPTTQKWWSVMEPMQQPKTANPESGGQIWKRFFISIDKIFFATDSLLKTESVNQWRLSLIQNWQIWKRFFI